MNPNQMGPPPQGMSVGQQGALARQGSILDALQHLERDKLAQYCQDIRVDGVIAQSASVKLGMGQTMWCSRGSLMAYSSGVDWALKVPGGAGKAVGRMLSGEIKAVLIEVMQKLVKEHQEARARVTDDVIDSFMKVRKLNF